jgi:hypothetical protein
MITIGTINRFGFLISLIGEIGGGKSSGQSAITHAYTVIFQQKIIELMTKVKTIYKSIDFNDIDEYLYSAFTEQSEYDFNQIVRDLFHIFNINQNIVYDFFSYKTTFDYFKDYVFSFYVLYIRNNYVYSVTHIFNRISGNFNMKLNLEWHKIKEAYKKQDYGIEDFAVELIDEASDELASGFWHDLEKDESGAKEYRRKYRHIHQERNRMIDTRQDSSDMVKKLRNLTQTHLEMTETKYIFLFKELYMIIQSLLKSKMFLYKLFKLYIPYAWYKLPRLRKGMSYQEFYDIRYATINKLRNQYNKILYIEWYLKSYGLVRFYAKKYHSADDVGKTSEEYFDRLKLYFPALWAFGTYEQFAFNSIQEQLLQFNKRSNQAEVNIFFQPSYFEKVISPKDDRKGVVNLDNI